MTVEYFQSFSTRINVRIWSYAGGTFDLALDRGEHDFGKLPGTAVAYQSQRTIADHGSFRLTLRFSSLGERARFFEYIRVDDYIGVASTSGFIINFGYIAAIRHQEMVVDGATVLQTVLVCLDWGNRYSQTEVWFDVFSQTVLSLTALAQVVARGKLSVQPPGVTVHGLAAGLPALLATNQRSQWALPDSLAGELALGPGQGLLEAVIPVFRAVPYPYRVNTLIPRLSTIEEPDLWTFLRKWSEPDFAELYTDLTFSQYSREDLNGSLTPIQQPGSEWSYFRPALIYRDRPLLSSSLRDREAPLVPLSLDDARQPWNALPSYTVSRRMIADIDVAASNVDRKTAFFLNVDLPTSLSAQFIMFQRPIYLGANMLRYGVRRCDGRTPYLPIAAGGGFSGAGVQLLKERLRDYHCMNHLLYSGTITLNSFMPARVGSKLFVGPPGDSITAQTNNMILSGAQITMSGDDAPVADGEAPTWSTEAMEYYVEGVSHSWSLVSGLRTSFTVTHGFPAKDGLRARTLRAMQFDTLPEALPDTELTDENETIA